MVDPDMSKSSRKKKAVAEAPGAAPEGVPSEAPVEPSVVEEVPVEEVPAFEDDVTEPADELTVSRTAWRVRNLTRQGIVLNSGGNVVHVPASGTAVVPEISHDLQVKVRGRMLKILGKA